MSKLSHRITSLERWGMRVSSDFQPSSVAFVKNAGYTGVLVNGGSGIGPDMMTVESLVATQALPDLMPLTVQGHQREMNRRCTLLKESGLKPWLTIWGVAGPDFSAGSKVAESNRLFDRRSKLEMHAKYRRTPEIFGSRDPWKLSWRGSRPLCVSHPLVQEFYRELYGSLPLVYPDLEGIFYFPGDADPELCDETCERCRITGLSPWEILMRHVNDIFRAIRKTAPTIQFYYSIWNQERAEGRKNITQFLAELDPDIGINMSLSDQIEETRRSGRMYFNQPWPNISGLGDMFVWASEQAHIQGRSLMGMAEISQSELWDPVCHNMPLPRKVLQLLRNAENVNSLTAICDFWGNCAPFEPHANHAAMRAYFDSPFSTEETLLAEATVRHYNYPDDSSSLRELALEAWSVFERVVDEWALTGWAHRFSFSIGRLGARGRIFPALVSTYFKDSGHPERWEIRASLLQGETIPAAEFARYQDEDRAGFLAAAEKFRNLAKAFREAGALEGGEIADREAWNIELAGELTASIGRTVLATQAYKDENWSLLRQIIAQEIDGRERQLEISGFLGAGCGVEPSLVSEDIQNMRLYLSCDDFPFTPEELFSFTPTPYST